MGEYWVGSHFSLLPNKVSVSAVMHYSSLDTVAGRVRGGARGEKTRWRGAMAHPPLAGDTGAEREGGGDRKMLLTCMRACE